jgi:predicted O-linked N-acetylglucosamine transferase (SPINDLY family)
MADESTLLQHAIQLHQQNHHAEAYAAYQQVLAVNPANAIALHHLGILELSVNRLDAAYARLITAAKAAPTDGGPHFHLGEVARIRGNIAEAMAEYQLAIQLSPQLLVAYQSLGEVLLQQGRAAQAVAPLTALVQRAPHLSGAWLLLGQALLALHRRADAADVFRHIVQLVPQNVQAHWQLGDLEMSLGRPQAAIAPLQTALVLSPREPAFHSALARALDAVGKHEQALPHHQQAAELMPSAAGAFNNYGVALHRTGRSASAEKQLRRALQIDPKLVSALTNLGSVLHEQGRPDEALECYRRAIQLNPKSAKAHSVFLYLLHFNASFDAEAIAGEHRIWADQYLRHVEPVARAYAVDTNPDRKLRIGYVSADFRGHVVGRFLLPILQLQDREQFEVYCYSDTTVVDAMTDTFKATADAWRETAGLNDAQLAALIGEDRVDILIDLTGHMDGSRLLTFAARPAPVQISHIGYPASSGVPAIGYRISDRQLDPVEPGNERLLYLPNSFYLYRPEAAAPVAAVVPPMVASGFATFGSLNSPKKLSPLAIELWAMVLARTPGSKLMLAVLPDVLTHGLIVDRFTKHGIEPDRLILEPTRDFLGYMSLYNRIDIALDPQPYGGGITTCDALWMGVPVVSLIGKTSVGRTGASLLRALGLTELLADSAEQYAAIAQQVAANVKQLTRWRQSLPDALRASPMMNERGYTRDLERLYREAWRDAGRG